MFTARLQQSFADHRRRAAIEFPRRGYTFGELEHSVARVAAWFERLGIEPGQRVILFTESKEPFLLGYLGAVWRGAVPLPLNPALKLAELNYFVNDSAASLLVFDARTEPVVEQFAKATEMPVQLYAAAELLAAAASATPTIRAHDPLPGDPALILYSSGTTGEPKGVVHTQANLAAAVEAIARAWRFAPDDVLANVLPLFHIHGLSFATNVSLLAGGTMLVGDSFHPVRTLDLIDRSTVFMGVPPYNYAFLKRDEFRARATGWKQLRLVTCGSAPIRAEVLPELESILGRPVINRYGMTECHVLTSLPLDGPWPHGSVGRPLAGIEVAVRRVAGVESSSPQQTENRNHHRLGARRLDPSHPSVCAPGEVGRVFARGPNLFREYWRQPEATRECFDHDGWFDTGDMGQFDDCGFLTLVGRSKDLIIVGGFNVYPAVVERVLRECPGVRDAAVVGVPDETRGERIVAFVVADDPALDAAQIRGFSRERLVDYQCPTWIEVVPELPRNAMGKVLKRELRERFAGGGVAE